MMTRLKRAIGACILASALLPIIPVHAATYYVAATGSNSHPGTEKQPWRTIGHAVSAMVAGDTTFVRGGVFNETFITFRRSGTAAAPIKLLNYPGEAPIIQCNPSSPATGVYHRIVISHQNGINVAIGWITIEGFEIRNCWDGLKFNSTHDLTIRRNWIHDNFPGQGILGNGTRVLIERNVINHNGGFDECLQTAWKCNQDHGIYTNGTAYTITNNLIYDNLAFGIQLAGAYPFDPAKHAGPEYTNSANWIIANNTFAYERYRGAIVVWGSSCNNAWIENNIFYENGVQSPSGSVQGIEFVSMTCTGVQIRNNLSYTSGSGSTAFLDTGPTEGTHYTQSGNVLNSNPAFVNGGANALPTSPNFALTERSAAIDKGMSLTTVTTTTFDGTVRPQGRAYDIGAYEYKTGDDVKSPAAPIALQAH